MTSKNLCMTLFVFVALTALIALCWVTDSPLETEWIRLAMAPQDDQLAPHAAAAPAPVRIEARHLQLPEQPEEVPPVEIETPATTPGVNEVPAREDKTVEAGSNSDGPATRDKQEHQRGAATLAAAVADGLEWLKRHQDLDGSWHPETFTTRCERSADKKCTGTGSEEDRAGITGLVLLTFLNAGHNTRSKTTYSELVHDGLWRFYLLQAQDGYFGDRAAVCSTYGHACATLAICTDYAATRNARWKIPAQLALDFIVACQNPGKGWRYGPRPGDSDSSVTGWMLKALRSGRDAGLKVPEQSVLDGMAFIDSITDRRTGITGYRTAEDFLDGHARRLNRWSFHSPESLTAAAMTARRCSQAEQSDDELTRLGAKLLSAQLPKWDADTDSANMNYWYWGTLAMSMIGGTDWQRWSTALKSAVMGHQIKDGCMKGSWDPKGVIADYCGRVYSTCVMTHCLDICARYPVETNQERK